MRYFTLTRVSYTSECAQLRNLRILLPSSVALTDGVDKTPESKQDEISEELEEFGNCQHSEAEPQAEHSTKIRNVLCTLYVVSSAKHKCSLKYTYRKNSR